MHHFAYRDGRLFAEEIPVEKIAQEVGTPFYCYSHATLERHFQAFEASLGSVPHLVCFSVKSNSNLAVLNVFLNQGAGLDVVSGGAVPGPEGRGGPEEDRVRRCGQDRSRDGGGPESGDPSVQRGVGTGASCPGPGGGAGPHESARGPSDQPGHQSADPPVHIDRFEAEQIRDPLRQSR